MDVIKSITADFPNGLRTDQFQDELNGSSSMTAHVSYINTDDDVVTIHFDATLTVDEEATLSALCSAHIPAPLKTTPQLFIENGTVKWIDATNVPRVFLGTQTSEIHISKETQGQFSSIKAAIQAVNSPNVVFYVHPGQYVEDNPIVVPPGCTVMSKGTAVNTYIIAANATQDIIRPGPLCTVQGFTFIGALGPGARGVYFDGSQSGGTGQFTLVSQCFFRGCQIALESDGKNIPGIVDTLYLRELVISPLPPPYPAVPLDKAVYCHSGGSVISSSVMISGFPAPYNIPIGTGVYCTDAGSKVAMAVTSTWYCTQGLLLNNDANSECALFTSRNNGTGVVIGEDGLHTRLSVASLDIKDSSNWDIDVMAQDCEFGLHSGFADPGKVRNPNGVKLNAKFNSSAYGKYYQASTGDVMIGTVSNPSKMAIGEGRYDQSNVTVFKNASLEDNASWTDVTLVASIFPSSAFDLFPSTAAGNCIYLGRAAGNVVGLKIEVTTACVSPVNNGDLVWEYWDGTQWTSFNVMQTSSEPPNESVSVSFLNQVGKYHIRFGLTSLTPFALKALNGVERYWARLRVVNALPSNPQTQYLKFHTHAAEFNKDGFLEFFGDSRSVQSLRARSVPFAPNSSSSFVNINIASDGSTVDTIKSLSLVGTMTFLTQLPRDLDTSFPVKCNVSFTCTTDTMDTNTNVTWIVRWSKVKKGDPMWLQGSSSMPTTFEPSNTSSLTKQSTILAATNNQDLREQFAIDTSFLCPNVSPVDSGINDDMLFISIERDMANSDYTGTMIINNVSFSYVSWCNGTHLLSF
jgi:hypothetical protein